MKVIHFPGAEPPPTDGRALGLEIDAMLDGELGGAEGLALRELREDVRSLAPAPSSDFERELQARVAQWKRDTRRPEHAGVRAPVLRALRAAGEHGRRRLAFAGAAATVIAVVLAVMLSGGSGIHLHAGGLSGSSASSSLGSSARTTNAKGDLNPVPLVGSHHAARAGSTGGGSSAGAAEPQSAGEATAKLPPQSSVAVPLTPFAASPGRLQQRGASVTLATSLGGVQSAAEAVMRLAVADGGFVESSQVQQRSQGTSEASLALSLPSAKLSAAIAALGRIAPVREVSQESQDITSSYDSAKRRLADAEAVRRALLRALSAAGTESKIDSLREQLAANREVIARERTALKSVEQHANTSVLNVAISGGAAAATASKREGLTLRRGLRDAGRVLSGAAAVVLIALAAILPLALIGLGFVALRQAWLRRRREAALEP
ncbi:MAG TPA: DUF4349 domain-containing protein [Solirubrobacteraceae bacterium]|jgi:hypothetical protein|nr:DUF4349 domain-containing protein [Solirubrobacteraceae bacterium]